MPTPTPETYSEAKAAIEKAKEQYEEYIENLADDTIGKLSLGLGLSFQVVEMIWNGELHEV